MKVSIDESICDGRGECAMICPQVFAVDYEGPAFVLDPEPEPSLRECVRSAQKACPRNAIIITR